MQVQAYWVIKKHPFFTLANMGEWTFVWIVMQSQSYGYKCKD